MRLVQGICALTALLAFAACASERAELPPDWGRGLKPTKAADSNTDTEDEVYVEPRAHTPRGCVGNPDDRVFHRVDCPHVKAVSESDRKFFVTPFDALNEQYHPCEYCEPLAGWE